MNEQFISRLLYRAEGEALDFKQTQYPFEKTHEEAKRSEILKDILAFANGWRTEEACILLGVIEGQTQVSKVVGVSHHLSDSNLQQFINSKINRPIRFSYQPLDYKGLKVGAILIPVQKRPFYAIKDYGIVKKDVVYVRRGSSCAEADMDEVAQMGKEELHKEQTPNLEMQFADISSRNSLGTNLNCKCRLLEISSDVQIYLDKKARRGYDWEEVMRTDDPLYHHNLVKYLIEKEPLHAIGFTIQNLSGVLGKNVRIEICGPNEDHLLILDETSYPTRPENTRLKIPNVFSPISQPCIELKTHSQRWTLVAKMGDIQPRATSWSDDCFYIGATRTSEFELEAKIFADNLANPITIPIRLSFEIYQGKLVPDDLTTELERE
ncbi:MAG: ATP-binding protein [Nitrospirales bacterium]|nr:ATP-binding protein [Nitrospirales bacterium]